MARKGTLSLSSVSCSSSGRRCGEEFMGANLVEEWKGQKEKSYYYYDYQLIYIFHCYLLFYYCLRVRVFFSERR